MKHKTKEFLRDNRWKKLHGLGFGDEISYATLQTWSMRETTDREQFYPNLNFLLRKHDLKRIKRWSRN